MKAKAPLIVTSFMVASSLALPVAFAASQGSSKDMYRTAKPDTGGHVGLMTHGKKPIKIKIDHDVVMADDLMMKGKFGEAAEAYHQATIKKPDNVPATIGYGMALAKQFKLDAANDQFDKALAIDPNNAMAHSGKAIVMFNRLQSSSKTVINNKENLLKQAEEECRKGLATDPDMPEAHYTLGMILKEQGRLDDAENEFKEATKIDPQYSEAFAGLGVTQMTKGDTDGALQSFKTAVGLNSGNSTAHYGLGKCYVKQGNFDEAIKELNTSLYQNTNSAPARLAMGEAYAGQGNTVAAVKEFQESIRIKPENVEAYLHIADVREARGDLEHSIADLRSGLELLPDATELHSRIADESLKLEKLDDAIKEYQTVLNANAGDANAARGLTQAFCMKGSKEATGAYFQSNEFENSKAYIDKAIAMNPNDLQLRLSAAKMRVMSGEDVDLSKIGTPTNDGERIAYSQALLVQNKFKDADAQMNTVINNLQNAKDAYAVGDMALMNHDLASADAAYKKAGTFTHSEERSKRSNDQITHAKEQSKQELTLADDLSRKKQIPSAIDKYHNSIYQNPRVAQARLGLAEAFEKETPPTSKDLRAAIVQWHAFIDLSPDLLPKELDKLNKHVVALDKQATRVAAKEAKDKGKPVKRQKLP